MTQESKQDRVIEAVVSRRRLLTTLGLLTLAGMAGSSLVIPDEAEAGGRGKKKGHRIAHKKGRGKKLGHKKHHGKKKHH